MRMSFEPNRQKRQLGPGNQEEEDVGFGKRRKILLMMTFFTVLLFYDTALFSPLPTPPTHNSTSSPDSGLLAVIASDSQIQGMLSYN